jgi:hypothetical protein
MKALNKHLKKLNCQHDYVRDKFINNLIFQVQLQDNKMTLLISDLLP